MPWELNGNANTDPNTDFLGTTDQEPLVIKTNGNEAVRVDGTGNVGIGTPSPGSKLEIAGAQDGLNIVGFEPYLTLSDSNSGFKVRIQDANGDLFFYTDNGVRSGNPAMVIRNDKNTVEIHAQDGLLISGFQPYLRLYDSNNDRTVRIQDTNGDLFFYTDNGVRSGNPAMVIRNDKNTVEIHAQDGLLISGFQPFLRLYDSNSDRTVQIQDANGDVVIFTDSALRSGIPAMVIKDGSGDVTLTGNLTVNKDIFLPGADCAEHFDVAGLEKIEPGTVMVINEDGALEPSQQAYDKKVAGVVSGAGEFKHGIILDKQQTERARMPIALIGKVYCRVDSQYVPIEVGDLLTTSPTPGHAMKADDHLKAFGAVIGKALRPLRSGQGLIPILIALQ